LGGPRRAIPDVHPPAPQRRPEEESKMASKLFPRNEHNVERALRVLVGVGLLSLVFVGPQSWWGLVGLVPLITGLAGTCPLYTLLGFSTCPMSTR
jgi:hypothetical protein